MILFLNFAKKKKLLFHTLLLQHTPRHGTPEMRCARTLLSPTKSTQPLFNTKRREPRPTLSFYDQTVEKYASQSPLHVTPEYIVKYSETVDRKSILKLSQFLHKELPVRLARTLRDFQALPYIVGVNPHIEGVYEEYGHSFDLLLQHDSPDTFEKHESFCQLLTSRLNLHADVISNMSKGIKDVRVLPDSARIDFKYIDTFLDRALVQRIGRRVLGELLLVLHHKVFFFLNVNIEIM